LIISLSYIIVNYGSVFRFILGIFFISDINNPSKTSDLSKICRISDLKYNKRRLFTTMLRNPSYKKNHHFFFAFIWSSKYVCDFNGICLYSLQLFIDLLIDWWIHGFKNIYSFMFLLIKLLIILCVMLFFFISLSTFSLFYVLID
jgi:hypothetical protein